MARVKQVEAALVKTIFQPCVWSFLTHLAMVLRDAILWLVPDSLKFVSFSGQYLHAIIHGKPSASGDQERQGRAGDV
jgi:hypothetical protein